MINLKQFIERKDGARQPRRQRGVCEGVADVSIARP